MWSAAAMRTDMVALVMVEVTGPVNTAAPIGDHPAKTMIVMALVVVVVVAVPVADTPPVVAVQEAQAVQELMSMDVPTIATQRRMNMVNGICVLIFNFCFLFNSASLSNSFEF